MRDTADKKADQSATTWRGAMKKEKWNTLKEGFSGFGAAVVGASTGLLSANPAVAAIGAAAGLVVGGGFKVVGSTFATRGQARDDAKKAEAVEVGSAGGGGGSLGALKGVLFGAAASAEDCSSRIRSMKDKVEALLADLQSVLDSSSNSQVASAIGEMGQAISALEKAYSVAGSIGDKTKTWAAAL